MNIATACARPPRGSSFPAFHTPAGRTKLAVTTIFSERQFGLVNWLGFWTLYCKEVRRFMKVYTQTLLAPMATTLLYLAVFSLALSAGGATTGGGYSQFLAPGLIMMSITQNAFANTSSSVVIAKLQGNIVDILMPPLSAGELTIALALGGATRGIVVGAAVGITMAFFVPVQIEDWGLVLFNGVAASLMLSTIGIIGGLWSEKFDHIAAVTNFIVIPLTFLSGTFYSIERLHEPFQTLARLDPFFYMIDGFRCGFIGHGDSSALLGAMVLIVLNIVLLAWCWRLFAIGYKVKS
jgi:ABC-2 type transport system permease protein